MRELRSTQIASVNGRSYNFVSFDEIFSKRLEYDKNQSHATVTWSQSRIRNNTKRIAHVLQLHYFVQLWFRWKSNSAFRRIWNLSQKQEIEKKKKKRNVIEKHLSSIRHSPMKKVKIFDGPLFSRAHNEWGIRRTNNFVRLHICTSSITDHLKWMRNKRQQSTDCTTTANVIISLAMGFIFALASRIRIDFALAISAFRFVGFLSDVSV